MKSIRDLYKVGKGPSSSHTMGPERAARIFKQENPGAERYEVTLYGSLALTGVGHGTDRVLSEVLAPSPDGDHLLKEGPRRSAPPEHTRLCRLQGRGKACVHARGIHRRRRYRHRGPRAGLEMEDVYPENSFAEIAEFCRWRYISA